MEDANIDLTAITTPLCLLDEATRAALKGHGGPYEYLNHAGNWDETNRLPLWTLNLVYRVKPSPKRETVRMWLVRIPIHGAVAVTIDLIDGKPDWDSVKPVEDGQV